MDVFQTSGGHYAIPIVINQNEIAIENVLFSTADRFSKNSDKNLRAAFGFTYSLVKLRLSGSFPS